MKQIEVYKKDNQGPQLNAIKGIPCLPPNAVVEISFDSKTHKTTNLLAAKSTLSNVRK
jgi:hypothetical protein